MHVELALDAAPDFLALDCRPLSRAALSRGGRRLLNLAPSVLDRSIHLRINLVPGRQSNQI